MTQIIVITNTIRLGSPTKSTEALSSSSSGSGGGSSSGSGSSRRLSHTDIFPTLLSKMVMKLCIEHPHHTLPQLFALAHERDIGAQVRSLYVCMYVCTCTCTCMCMYVQIFVRTYVLYIYTTVACMYVHVCIYFAQFKCMYVCMYVCIYVCMQYDGAEQFKSNSSSARTEAADVIVKRLKSDFRVTDLVTSLECVLVNYIDLAKTRLG